MSGIRHLAKSLCPRCLTKKSQAHEMGMVRDRLRRIKKARKDNDSLKNKIEKAKKLIYTKGVSIGSKRIEHLLADESLVPTRVSSLNNT